MHRAALKTALEKAQYDVESMEKYPAFDQRPLDKCLADVAAADIYVLILAHRYGFRPKESNSERKSITHLEYEEAGRHEGKPRFVFTVDPEYPWSPKWMDKRAKDIRDLETFRKAVESRHGVSRFTNPNQLASLVLQALHAWESETSKAQGEISKTPAHGLPTTASAIEVQSTGRRTEEAVSVFIAAWQQKAQATFQRAFIDFSAFITDKTLGFVGRRFVFDAVDRFLAQTPSGYFVLRGDPGIGKTAIMAQMAKSRQYPHHFNVASEGIGSSKQFFLNACAQLIAGYGLEHASFPDDAGGDNNYFKRILAEAASKAPRVVLLIDALDETTEPLAGGRANPLQLPTSLPANVYIVVSTRRTGRQLTAEHVELFELDATSGPNIRDIEEYIEVFAARAAMKAQLEQQGIEIRDFVAMVRDKSEGNFMYLHHVLPAVEKGRFVGDRRLEIPDGLEGYYRSHWERMRGDDLDAFRRVNQPIIACLATAHRPITLRFLARVTSLSLTEVQWTVERWSEFLHQSSGKDGTEFRIYHASYRDFLAKQVAE